MEETLTKDQIIKTAKLFQELAESMKDKEEVIQYILSNSKMSRVKAEELYDALRNISISD